MTVLPPVTAEGSASTGLWRRATLRAAVQRYCEFLVTIPKHRRTRLQRSAGIGIMTTPNAKAPAGWYGDGSGRQRWWDGQQWGASPTRSAHRLPQLTSPPPPAMHPPPPPLRRSPLPRPRLSPRRATSSPLRPTPAPAPAYAGSGALTYPGSGAPAYVGAPYGSESTAKPMLIIVALVSAVVGALGFIFAYIPGVPSAPRPTPGTSTADAAPTTRPSPSTTRPRSTSAPDGSPSTAN